MSNYLRNKFKAEPIAIISLIITFLVGGTTLWLNWHVFESSKSTKLEFLCNDAGNSNGYIDKDETYLLIEVQCKIRHLGSKNISIDSYGGVYYLDNVSYPNKGHFDEDKINKSSIKNSDYFKVPFPLAPGDQKNVNLFIQIPIAYEDKNKGLSECSPNEAETNLGSLNSCFATKTKRPIPNYLYETIQAGEATLNDIGLRVYTSDSKSYDSKVTFYHLMYKGNEKIPKLSSDRYAERDMPNLDKWFMRKIRHDINTSSYTLEYIDLRYVIGLIIFYFVGAISYIGLRFKYRKIVLFVKHKKIQFTIDSLVLLFFLLAILVTLPLLFGLNILYILFR
jgi:hypothetical protein